MRGLVVVDTKRWDLCIALRCTTLLAEEVRSELEFWTARLAKRSETKPVAAADGLRTQVNMHKVHRLL